MAIEFSAQSKQQIDRLLTRYPTKQAALLPVLHVAQDEFGHLPDDVIELVAKTLELPLAHVFGVVTFYTMFHREKHGTNELMVCTNVSCMLRGAYDILGHIEKRLGIKAGETTKDGVFTIVEEECLAACANAPMMICGSDYFLDLTPQKVDTILDDMRRRAGVPTGGAGGGGAAKPHSERPVARTMLGIGNPVPAGGGGKPATTPSRGLPIVRPTPAGINVPPPPRPTPAAGSPLVPPLPKKPS